MRYLITYGEYMGDEGDFNEVCADTLKDLLLDVFEMDADTFSNTDEMVDEFNMNNGDGGPYIIVYEIGREKIRKVLG